MRPWEALIVGLAAFSAVLLFIPPLRRQSWMHLLPWAGIPAFAMHWLLEGCRWQMAPVYCVAVILALVAAANLRPLHRSSVPSAAKTARWPRLLGAVVSLLFLALAGALAVLFPLLRLPMPSGPYAVGTTNLHFVDRQRPETFTPAPNDCRELFVQVWYPAETPAGTKPVSYCENAREISRALTGPTPFPSFLFDHLGLVRSHSFRDAEMARGDERFPIAIFSHAYWGSVSQCTALMEELASHGYVAVSVGHPYETPYLIQADGHIKAFDPRNDQFRLRGIERTAAYRVEQRLTQTRDRDQLEALMREISRLRPKTVESVRIWARDISSTIDVLETMNLDDVRCKAGVNMDGLQLGDMLDRDMSRPFLFMHHDNVGAVNRTPNRVFFDRARAPAYLMTIEETGHLSFSDISFYGRASIFRLMSPVGEIDGRRCHRIVCDYVLAFLDKYLRGQDSGLLDGPCSQYPEVEIADNLHLGTSSGTLPLRDE